MRLRPLELDDWEAVHDWARRPESCRYQVWGPNTPEQTKAFVQAVVQAWSMRPPTWFVYAIVLDGLVVGNAGLRLHGNYQGEVSYAVHPDWWGNGLATQAGQRILAIAFREHKLHRIFGTVDPRNADSARVLGKLGMTYEGRLRETMLIRDGWRDSDIYSILETEWAPSDQPGELVQDE